MLAAGFRRCRCLSSGLLPLCCIVRPEIYVARAWSWAVSHLTREAQRSSELIASRHDAGPFVLNTNLRPQERPIIPAGNGTVARVLCDALMNHVPRPLAKRKLIGPKRSVPTRVARDQAQRVNVQSGYSMQNKLKCT